MCLCSLHLPLRCLAVTSSLRIDSTSPDKQEKGGKSFPFFVVVDRKQNWIQLTCSSEAKKNERLSNPRLNLLFSFEGRGKLICDHHLCLFPLSFLHTFEVYLLRLPLWSNAGRCFRKRVVCNSSLLCIESSVLLQNKLLCLCLSRQKRFDAPKTEDYSPFLSLLHVFLFLFYLFCVPSMHLSVMSLKMSPWLGNSKTRLMHSASNLFPLSLSCLPNHFLNLCPCQSSSVSFKVYPEAAVTSAKQNLLMTSLSSFLSLLFVSSKFK